MIITIEGPTGAGKSHIAHLLALELGSQIVNSDSRQIYKYLDIGTAKPSKEDLAELPYHLIDIVLPNQRYDAGSFIRDADKAIEEIKALGQIPIICGGTGLYVRSLLQGLFKHAPIQASIRAELKEELQQKGIEALYEELSEVDRDFASKISTNDPQRILRGLEVYRATSISLSRHWQMQEKQQRYQALRILVNPDREELYQRINSRLPLMIEAGLLKEIEQLLDMGYSFDDPGLNSLGYKEFRPYFEGQDSWENCLIKAAQHHRNYAKRQLTWYRKIKFDFALSVNSFNLSDIIKAVKQ